MQCPQGYSEIMNELNEGKSNQVNSEKDKEDIKLNKEDLKFVMLKNQFMD